MYTEWVRKACFPVILTALIGLGAVCAKYFATSFEDLNFHFDQTEHSVDSFKRVSGRRTFLREKALRALDDENALNDAFLAYVARNLNAPKRSTLEPLPPKISADVNQLLGELASLVSLSQEDSGLSAAYFAAVQQYCAADRNYWRAFGFASGSANLSRDGLVAELDRNWNDANYARRALESAVKDSAYEVSRANEEMMAKAFDMNREKDAWKWKYNAAGYTLIAYVWILCLLGIWALLRRAKRLGPVRRRQSANMWVN
jgi:hypothetical protein